MSANETIADIVAEMRHGLDKSWHEIDREWVHGLADRFEAAWKREELLWAKANGELAQMLDCEKEQGGNAAAMREALERIREIAIQWQADEIDGVAGTTNKPEARSASEAVIEIEFVANAALAAQKEGGAE